MATKRNAKNPRANAGAPATTRKAGRMFADTPKPKAIADPLDVDAPAARAARGRTNTATTTPHPPASRTTATPPPQHHDERTAMNRILLVDLGERELKNRQKLRAERQSLLSLKDSASTSGGQNIVQSARVAEIDRLLQSDVTVDPFYRKVAETQQQIDWDDLDGRLAHEYGLFGSQRMANGAFEGLELNEREIAGIAGLLQVDGYTDFDIKRPQGFVQRISTAQGEYRANRALFDAAFTQLSQQYVVTLKSQIEAGLIDADIVGSEWPRANPESRRGITADNPFKPSLNESVAALSARNIAALVRRLASSGVSANDSWLASRIQNGYEMQAGVIDGAPISSTEISLPEFDDATDTVAVQENLFGAQAVAFAASCEDMNMPQVVEKIVDLFRTGLLPVSRGKAGDYLYAYLKKAGERMTQGERLDLYRQVLGRNEGDPNTPANVEFKELWLRFVAAVSSFARQLSVDRIMRSQVPIAVSQEQVRKAGRDLAANLSVHSFGIVRFAAAELQQTILEYRDLLSDAELRACFGARDMWQVMDQVNANYLGGPRNTHRHRTQARSSAVIIRWLAKHPDRISGRYGEVISINALTNSQMRGSEQPMVDPNDWDLVQACEQWLAVGGVQDDSIERYAQSSESPTITSRPIENRGIPQAARDVLDSAGISLPGM